MMSSEQSFKRPVGHDKPRLLSECGSGVCTRVVGASSTRAMEMGFFPGVRICVISNDAVSVCMVVQAGESRLVIPREIAATVAVCRGERRGWWHRGWRRRFGGCDVETDS